MGEKFRGLVPHAGGGAGFCCVSWNAFDARAERGNIDPDDSELAWVEVYCCC